MRNFVREVWEQARPYLIDMAADLLIALGLLGTLWIFDQWAHIVVENERVLAWLVNVHSAGVVVAIAVFITFFTVDVVRRKRDGPRDEEEDR